MNIQLVGEEHDITNHDRDVVDEHFRQKIEPLLGEFDEDLIFTRVKIGEKQPFGYITSCTMTLPQKCKIQAESDHEDVRSAVVQLTREVKKQLHTESSDYDRTTIRKM